VPFGAERGNDVSAQCVRPENRSFRKLLSGRALRSRLPLPKLGTGQVPMTLEVLQKGKPTARHVMGRNRPG
jgi:hypothetical protein